MTVADVAHYLEERARWRWERWPLDYTGAAWTSDWGSNLIMSPGTRLRRLIESIGIAARSWDCSWSVAHDYDGDDDERPTALLLGNDTDFRVIDLRLTARLLRLGTGKAEIVVPLAQGGRGLAKVIAELAVELLPPDPAQRAA